MNRLPMAPRLRRGWLEDRADQVRPQVCTIVEEGSMFLDVGGVTFPLCVQVETIHVMNYGPLILAPNP